MPAGGSCNFKDVFCSGIIWPDGIRKNIFEIAVQNGIKKLENSVLTLSCIGVQVIVGGYLKSAGLNNREDYSFIELFYYICKLNSYL